MIASTKRTVKRPGFVPESRKLFFSILNAECHKLQPHPDLIVDADTLGISTVISRCHLWHLLNLKYTNGYKWKLVKICWMQSADLFWVQFHQIVPNASTCWPPTSRPRDPSLHIARLHFALTELLKLFDPSAAFNGWRTSKNGGYFGPLESASCEQITNHGGYFCIFLGKNRMTIFVQFRYWKTGAWGELVKMIGCHCCLSAAPPNTPRYSQLCRS